MVRLDGMDEGHYRAGPTKNRRIDSMGMCKHKEASSVGVRDHEDREVQCD